MRNLLLAATLLMLAAASASAGVTVEMEVKDLTTSPPEQEAGTMRIEGKLLRIDSAAGGGQKTSAIYRGDRRSLLVLDHDQRRYMELDREMVEGLAGQLSAAMQQMEERLAELPPEQRAAVQRMMEQQMPGLAAGSAGADAGPTEIRRTGRRDTVSGIPCAYVEAWRGGEKVRELCVAGWGDVTAGREALAVFEDMGDFFEEVLDTFAEAMPMGRGALPIPDNPFQDMSRLDGFPVVVRLFEDGEVARETVITRIEETAVDPASFEPPAGYQRQEMPKPKGR